MIHFTTTTVVVLLAVYFYLRSYREDSVVSTFENYKLFRGYYGRIVVPLSDRSTNNIVFPTTTPKAIVVNGSF